VTGGGNLKDGKNVTWTFSGNAGLLLNGGAVGVFDLVDKANARTYHLDNFGWLTFSGPSADAPSALHNAVRFRASGTLTKGTETIPVSMVVMLQDNGEPGGGADNISAILVSKGGVTPSAAEAQLIGTVASTPEFPSLTHQVWKTIAGGNIQVHDAGLPATTPGRIILTMRTTPPGFSFPVYVSYGPQIDYPNGLSLSDGSVLDSGPILAPGMYTITQGAQPGWTLSAIYIDDPTADSSYILAAGRSTIKVEPGETVRVIYVNTGS